MKMLGTLMLIAGLAAGCSSSSSRGIASIEPSCSLEKHPSKNWYRFTYSGKATGKYWKSHLNAKKDMAKYEKSGKCH